MLDDGFAPEPCDLLVIGCGNILRGDDAVGPVLIRHLYERGVPEGVRVVDGGTSGMDVAFGMRGAARVVIVDAAATGAKPGTIYRVPAEELAELPPIDGLHTHNFRWDHALSFSAWLLGPLAPTDVTVYLIEAGSVVPGAPLTDPVEQAMEQVIELLVRDHYPAATVEPAAETVEITSAGYLHLSAEQVARWFAAGVLLAKQQPVQSAGSDEAALELLLVPVRSATNGGLVLRQRNAAGEHTLLISEVQGFAPTPGRFEASWDEHRGALVVRLDRSVSAHVGGDSGEAGRDD
ncbi:MAG: hydrogenase maturation protease [Nocardioides sp.]